MIVGVSDSFTIVISMVYIDERGNLKLAEG